MAESSYGIRAMMGGLPRVYWFLWAGMLVNRLGAFVMPFLTLFLTQSRGMTVARAGLVASLYGAGSMLGGPLGGLLADRVGRRATMLLGLFGTALLMLVVGLAPSNELLPPAIFTLGFFSELYRPAVQAAIADVVAPKDRVRAYSLLYWAVNLGFALAPPLAGMVAGRSFTGLFLANALSTLVFVGLVFLKVPETRPPLTGERPSFLSSLSRPLGDGVYMSFVVLAFVVATIFFQVTSMLPLEISRSGISTSTLGLILGVNGALIVLAQPFLIPRVQRFRRSSMLALGAVLTGVGFGASGLAHTPLEYAATVVIWTLGEISIATVAPAVIADLAPQEVRGGYQGMYQMAWGAASFVGPALGAQVFDRVGPSALWTACAALGLAAGLGQLVIAPWRRERMALLRAQGADAVSAGFGD